MAKYYGLIGYAVTVEDPPESGVWVESITERPYTGDILRFNRRWQNGEGANDNLSVSNQVSILADPFAYENFQNIRWIEWLKQKWIVSEVEVEYPRLKLTLGGAYNE